MRRTTVDFGIDLGTTNSSIAVLKGSTTEVLKNNDHSEVTPSAVWLNSKGREYEGEQAKQHSDDPDNLAIAFKRLIGTPHVQVFKKCGRSMTPVQLSATILKSLKNSVQSRMGEELEAAVITIPAAFEEPQNKATEDAARLAGIMQTTLLQEPVAAAFAYGFDKFKERAYWMIYDLGGGTFDVAVAQIHDGSIRVVNHGGDPYLGGKDIDQAIVEEIIAPAVAKEFHLTDFHPGNDQWKAVFARLRYYAEQAKIRLSEKASTFVTFPNLFRGCVGLAEEDVEFECELERSQIEPLIEVVIGKSLSFCKRVLSETRLGNADIEKLILVGGPTLTPYVRDRLTDSTHGLGIPLEFSLDPLTVVARGAAFFAGTLRLDADNSSHVLSGAYEIKLDYKPIGSDTEPPIGGQVVGKEGEDFTGYSIEFVEAEPPRPWRSGKIKLNADGTFVASLWADEAKRTHTYSINLFDMTGTTHPTMPEKIGYLLAIETGDPPLSHTIGVALANNSMRFFFQKGTPFPARKLCTDLRTAISLSRGESGRLLRIPVMRGDNERANRNLRIGTLIIKAEEIKRDVPVGSEVEITLKVDKSGVVHMSAFVPILSQEFDDVFERERFGRINAEELSRDVEIELLRFEEITNDATRIADRRATEIIGQIEEEGLVDSVIKAESNVLNDTEAGLICERKLLELRAAIDNAEDSVEWPTLVAKADDEIEIERRIVSNEEYGVLSDEKAAFATLERDIREVIRKEEKELLRAKISAMDILGLRIMMRQEIWWLNWFETLIERKQELRNVSVAESYIVQGRRAIAAGEFDALKSAVRQLAGLLPEDDTARKKVLSDVI